MEDEELGLRTKAELLCSGILFIPAEIRIPFPTSRSSAGPGAGNESVVVTFPEGRVKIPISRDHGDMRLRQSEKDNFEIIREDAVIASDVRLLPTLCHAPNQAFVCLGRSCVMHCLFCTIDAPDARGKNDLSVDSAFQMIMKAADKENFTAVAVTSGVSDTVDEQIDRMAQLIVKLREKLPNVPIGAEPLVEKREHVVKLKEAGASEIKINLEAARRDIFEKICPRRDYDNTIDAIGWAVEEFGRGAVTSNIIVGFGEEDEDIRNSLEMLSRMGSVGNLRKLRTNDQNLSRLTDALGKLPVIDEKRLIELLRMHGDILKKHSLATEHFKSMCFSCGCCDLVPGLDL